MSDRIPLDHLTSDQLDHLYERAETNERLAAHLAHALADAYDLPVSTVMSEAWAAMAAADPARRKNR